jgi:flotillin
MKSPLQSSLPTLQKTHASSTEARMEIDPGVWMVALSVIVGTLCLMICFARLYRKAGPNEALVIYGFRGLRIIRGGGTLILPMVEGCRELSLELMSFDVAPEQDLFTRQGVAVRVEAVAQIKVRSDPASIQTAGEQVLSKTLKEREGLIRLVMVGHLRGIVGQLAVEEIVKQPDMVSERMRATCAADMDKMGLVVISFTIKEVRDQNEYISNMGRPDVARIRRDADVASAEAERDTAIRRALAGRDAAVAQAKADQERVEVEMLSLTKQAEARRELEVKQAQYREAVQRQQAQADKAYEIQTNIMQQQVVLEQAKVQEAEIARRERELVATTLKPAEVEGRRIETLAGAEKKRLIAESEGRAVAILQQGQAEAEIISKKGDAEAMAMAKRATAYAQYSQAAILDRLIGVLPELVRGFASPLANVDKITIVSTGEGDAAGMNKLTGDMTRMASQVPALFETLSGLSLRDLLSQVRPMAVKGTKLTPVHDEDVERRERSNHGSQHSEV